MDRESIIVLSLIGGILLILLVFLAVLLAKRKKTSNVVKVKQKGDGKDYIHFIFLLYKKVPLLNKVFVKVKRSVEITYPADPLSINKQVSNILLWATLTFVGGVIGTLIIAKSDVYFILCGLTVTFVAARAVIHHRLRRMDNIILKQFTDFLTKVRHHYHDTPIIDVALYNTLDEIKYEIRLHIQKIYDIVISPNVNEEIEKYVGTEPNQYVLMFASLCATIKEYGDKKLKDGTSTFLNDIEYLKEEVDNEIIGRRRNDTAFAMLPAITLAPILFVKPLQHWAINNFEGIESYYSGIAGIASMAAIFVVSIVSYIFVSTLRDNGEVEEKENDIFSKLAAREGISEILAKAVNKNYTKYRRYNDMAHGMGDHTGMKALLLKRVTLSVAAFVVTLVIFISGILVGRRNDIQAWDSAFEEAMTPSEEYTESMRETSREYAEMYRKEKDVSSAEFKKELADDIVAHTKITNSDYASTMATEISNRLSAYQSTYYKWWQLLISIAFAFVAYNTPIWYLKFKQNIIDMRKEDEVVRYQSLMLILMNLDGTTIDVILEWLERFSYCFKESIAECRVNMASGPQEALEVLKDSERFEPFRDFVDNLLSIDKVGVHDAFDEIQTDRKYYMKKREQDREESLQTKVSRARRIIYIPMFATIALYLITPMAVYMLGMFQEMRGIL